MSTVSGSRRGECWYWLCIRHWWHPRHWSPRTLLGAEHRAFYRDIRERDCAFGYKAWSAGPFILHSQIQMVMLFGLELLPAFPTPANYNWVLTSKPSNVNEVGSAWSVHLQGSEDTLNSWWEIVNCISPNPSDRQKAWNFVVISHEHSKTSRMEVWALAHMSCSSSTFWTHLSQNMLRFRQGWLRKSCWVVCIVWFNGCLFDPVQRFAGVPCERVESSAWLSWHGLRPSA